MTSISILEFETCLQWQGSDRATLTTEHAAALPLGGLIAGHASQDRWSPETLLVGAAEGRTLQSFLERAQAEKVEILFYQSSAAGLRVEADGAPPHFTDIIVRPHVAVRSEEDAEQVRHIFAELPCRCFPSSILKLTPRIEPVIEVWDGPRAAERGPPTSRGTNASA